MNKRGQSQSPEGSRGRLKQRQHLTTSTSKPSATAIADTPKSIPPLRQTRSTASPIVPAPKVNVTTGTKFTTPSRQTRSAAVSIVTAPKANIATTGKRSATSVSKTTFKSVKHVSNSENENSDNSEDERNATQAIVVAVSDGDDDGNDDDDDKSEGSFEDSEFEVRPISSKALPGRDQYQLLVEVLVFTPLVATMTSSILLQSTLKDHLQAALDDIRAKEMEIVHDLQIETAYLSVSTKNAYKVVMTEYKNFCDNHYGARGLNRYELDGPKVVVFLEKVIFVKRTPKHVRPGIRERKVSLIRSDVIRSGVPIDGTLDTFDLESYVNAEMTAGRGTLTSTGKRTIKTPYSVSKIEQVIACLRLLQKLQLSRKASPSTSGLLKNYPLIDQAIQKYKHNLVGGILGAEVVQRNADGELTDDGRDQSTNSTTINHYTVAEHIRCLLFAWRQAVNRPSIMMREHFVLAVRHSMLLRDESLRSLNILDCSVDAFAKQPGGIQEVMTMVFTLRGEKNNQRGTPQHGMAVRHIDVRRCSIGAFAFYMFERFQVKNERWPDMTDVGWTAVKVIGSDGATRPIAYATARDATLAVFNSQHVTCTNVTHSGRHSGAKEAAWLKIPEDDIRTGGRWVHGTEKMHQAYLNKQPINFALAMAGFSTRPFHLRRNEIDPPLALQRLIFPFIESAIGAPGSQDNKIWMQECDQEMRQFDPNNPEDLDNIEPYTVEPTPSGSERSKSKSAFLAQRSNNRHVLRLMLRLRRVLLQDAAEYLHRYPDMSLSPLLNKDSLFKSSAFLAFKDEVSMCLHRHDPGVPDNLPPNLMEALQSWSRANANGVAATRSALISADQRMDVFEECFVTQAVQNNWVNDTLISLDEKMDLLQHLVARSQSFGIQPIFHPGIQQPILRPISQQQQQQQQQQQRLPSATPTTRPVNHHHQSIRPAPFLSVAPPLPTLIPKRQKPLLTLPASFKRHPGGTAAAAAAATTQGSRDLAGTSSSTTRGQGAAEASAPAKDWFVKNENPANTKEVYEEYERFDKLCSERKKQKLSISQTGAANKHMNNKKRIYEEVVTLKERNMRDESMDEEEALSAAFKEIDAVALPNSKKKYQFHLCVRYCISQRNARAGTEPGQGGTRERASLEIS